FACTQWDHRVCEIADLGLQELHDCDLVVSCVDSDIARVEIAWVTLALDLPVIDAGLGGPDYWHGRVSFFAGRRSACFCCKLSPRRRYEILARTQAIANSCWAPVEMSVAPSTPIMAAIVGSMQVDVGLRSLRELRLSSAESVVSWTQELCTEPAFEMKHFFTP